MGGLSTEKVDKRSEELIHEYYQHRQECKASSPDLDDRTIFEGWIIQKIAGIQTIILSLTEDLSKIRTLLLDPALLRMAQSTQKQRPLNEE